MGVLRIIVTIVMIIISVIMTIIILMQEGKSQGLGALAGTSNNDTYWGRNKGRTMEGFLVKFTTGLCVAFFVLSILLNMHLF